MFLFVDTCIIRLNDECECVRPPFRWDNKYTNQAEGAERGISAMEGRLYIRFLYKVVLRICCALLKNVLNSRNDAGLPAAGARACAGLELPGCLPVAVGTTHTDIKYYWVERKASRAAAVLAGYWWSVSHVSSPSTVSSSAAVSLTPITTFASQQARSFSDAGSTSRCSCRNRSSEATETGAAWADCLLVARRNHRCLPVPASSVAIASLIQS